MWKTRRELQDLSEEELRVIMQAGQAIVERKIQLDHVDGRPSLEACTMAQETSDCRHSESKKTHEKTFARLRNRGK